MTSSQALSDVRSRVLGMFMKNLWHFTKSYIERRKSIPLPSYFYIAFTHAGVTRCIYGGDNINVHVTGRCVGALVVNKLVADIKSGSIPANDAELVCLSAILHSESRDVKLCLAQPGIVELVNMASLVLGLVDTFKASDAPPDLRQTLEILSQAVLPQENTEIHSDQVEAGALSPIFDDGLERTIISRLHGFLTTCMLDASPLAEEVRTSCLRMCLKTLWRFSKEYHRTSNTLPYYFPHMLASPEMIYHFQNERDPVVRLMGCCFGAVIASDLVDTLNSETPVSFSTSDQNKELAYISALLGAEHCDDSLSPFQLHVTIFQKVVSLILGEVDIFFTDSEGMPVSTRGNMLVDTAKLALCILTNRLPDRRLIPGGLSMYLRWLLQDTNLDVENAFGLRGSKREAMSTLDRLQKKLASLLPAAR